MSELRTSYGMDFFKEDLPGFKLVSHVIFDKLLHILRQEIIHRLGNSYPSLSEVYENYSEVMHTLTKNKRPFHVYEKDTKSNKSSEKENNGAALSNFTISSNGTLCKFCASCGHPMGR